MYEVSAAASALTCYRLVTCCGHWTRVVERAQSCPGFSAQRSYNVAPSLHTKYCISLATVTTHRRISKMEVRTIRPATPPTETRVEDAVLLVCSEHAVALARTCTRRGTQTQCE